jgi:hypothetical protein
MHVLNTNLHAYSTYIQTHSECLHCETNRTLGTECSFFIVVDEFVAFKDTLVELNCF